MTDRPRFRELTHSTRFTFVRHGESEANRRNVIQGHRDYPLSEAGREHARAAGNWLAEREVDLVCSSPLERSHATAKIIAEETGVAEPLIIDELKELDTGVYSGKSLRDSPDVDPDELKRFRIYSWDAVPGAESREALHRRAVVAWDMLIDRANTGCGHIVAVTHGGMVQWIIKATIGGPDQRWMPVFGMSNCGISTFIAESTSDDSDALPLNTGFFGNWRVINHVPY
jgi:broad specificity phosphatase PhoE